MELICQHCDCPIDDENDITEVRYGLFIHLSCEIEYYSGLN